MDVIYRNDVALRRYVVLLFSVLLCVSLYTVAVYLACMLVLIHSLLYTLCDTLYLSIYYSLIIKRAHTSKTLILINYRLFDIRIEHTRQ